MRRRVEKIPSKGAIERIVCVRGYSCFFNCNSCYKRKFKNAFFEFLTTPALAGRFRVFKSKIHFMVLGFFHDTLMFFRHPIVFSVGLFKIYKFWEVQKTRKTRFCPKTIGKWPFLTQKTLKKALFWTFLIFSQKNPIETRGLFWPKTGFGSPPPNRGVLGQKGPYLASF